ncbi:MAG: 4Fe-4S binding protein [Campylobacteraceae bacterium]|jgi:pyruvate formate lyase activating enzyme|nr:4Fe-4S binding protein [Campylobacteraceae bacterium]
MANPADDPNSGYVLVYLGENGALLFHSGKCTKCGDCISACSAGALWLVEDGLCVSISDCVGCFDCVAACSAKALVKQGG